LQPICVPHNTKIAAATTNTMYPQKQNPIESYINPNAKPE